MLRSIRLGDPLGRFRGPTLVQSGHNSTTSATFRPRTEPLNRHHDWDVKKIGRRWASLSPADQAVAAATLDEMTETDREAVLGGLAAIAMAHQVGDEVDLLETSEKLAAHPMTNGEAVILLLWVFGPLTIEGSRKLMTWARNRRRADEGDRGEAAAVPARR
jgi:hypothetical protein